MKNVTQEDALALVYKYGDRGAAPDPQVVELAKSYTRLIEVCRRSREHATASVEAGQKAVKNLAAVES